MEQRKDNVPSDLVEPNYPTCPFRNILSRIGDKWSLLILYLLNASERPLRYGELEKSISDISSKMLSASLRSLEADDLIARKVYAEVPPKVEYSLTPLGSSLMPHVIALTTWATEHFDHIIAHREQYKKKSSAV
jgi:DNA-binding HxlR family transcriptional regulator